MMGAPGGVPVQMEIYRRGWRRTLWRRALQIAAVAVPVAIGGCVVIQVLR